jgi:hypothetical protein
MEYQTGLHGNRQERHKGILGVKYLEPKACLLKIPAGKGSFTKIKISG